jgi:hypothetical protein
MGTYFQGAGRRRTTRRAVWRPGGGLDRARSPPLLSQAYVDVRAASLHDVLTHDAEPTTPTDGGGWGGDGGASSGVTR